MNYRKIRSMNMYVARMKNAYVFKSYDTVIAMFDSDNNILYKNNCYYSVTTSHHMSYVDDYITVVLSNRQPIKYLTVHLTPNDLILFINKKCKKIKQKLYCSCKFNHGDLVTMSYARVLKNKLMKFIQLGTVFNLESNNFLVPKYCVVECDNKHILVQYDKLKLLEAEGGM